MASGDAGQAKATPSEDAAAYPPLPKARFNNAGGVQNAFKEHWTSSLGDHLKSFTVQLCSAGGSGALAKTVVAPLERVKILRQVQHMVAPGRGVQYRGFLEAWRQLPGREGGLRALWRGNGTNVVRLLPDVAFRFAVHDQFRVMFAPMDGSPPGVGEKLAAGAATGILKTLLFYPLDVCRTRITADQSSSAARPAAATQAAAAATSGSSAAGLATAAATPAGSSPSPGTSPASASAPATHAPAASSSTQPHATSTHASTRAAAATGSQPHIAAASASAAATGPSTPTSTLHSGTTTRALHTSTATPTSCSPAPLAAAATAHASGTGAGLRPPPLGRRYPTIRACVVETVRHEGVRGLYRGVLLSMGGVAPYLAISFTMYDELRRRLPSDRASTSTLWYPAAKMACGAAAAASAQLVVYPLDTVRRCMQMNGAADQAVRYASAWDCARKLAAAGGWRALYRGVGVNSVKTLLGVPVQFVMYDAIKSAVQALDPTTGVSSPL